MKTMELSGTIVPNEDKRYYDFFGIDSISPQSVKDFLAEANGEDVTFEVNSGGGDLWAGNEIAYAISTYSGHTQADIASIALSAATVVCCGAEKVRMAPGAQYMIHNVSMFAMGDHNDMEHAGDVLRNADKATSNVYRQKTGMSSKELLKLMNEETWLDADRALDLGFVDEIIGNGGATKTVAPFSLQNSAPMCITLTDEQKAEAKAALDSGTHEKEHIARQRQIELLRLRGGYKNEI